MFEKQCNQCNTLVWEVRLMLLNVMVVQELLYGVEVLGDPMSLNAWNETNKIQKLLFHRNLGVKSLIVSPIMFLEELLGL